MQVTRLVYVKYTRSVIHWFKAFVVDSGQILEQNHYFYFIKNFDNHFIQQKYIIVKRCAG